jgi:hypothetical protein
MPRAEQANEKEPEGDISSIIMRGNLVAAEKKCCREAEGE